MTTFRVTAIREIKGGNTITYRTTVQAKSAADAAVLVGDRIRANDVERMEITDGMHEPIKLGAAANLIDVNITRLPDSAPRSNADDAR